MRWLYIINIIAIQAFYRKYIVDIKIKKTFLSVYNEEKTNGSFIDDSFLLRKLLEDVNNIYEKKEKPKKDGTDGRPNKPEYNDSFQISKNMDILEKIEYLERNKHIYENKDVNILDEKTMQILYDYYGFNSISGINMKAGSDW